jgi:phospholipase/carboxylesterase
MQRTLRASVCFVLFALASAGCGGAASTAHGSTTIPGESVEAGVRAETCGTYTDAEPGVLSRDAQLGDVPFMEVVLGDASPCDAMPLIVVLHGLGGRPIVPRLPYRDLPVPVRVVMPRGPIPWGDGYAWSSVRVLDHEDDGLSATVRAQAERIDAFVEALRVDRGARGDVVLAGFSQGAILALAVAARHPTHVGLVIPLAGWLPPELRVDAGEHTPPIRWLHGIEDERVPYAMALEAATDLRARHWDVELLGYPGVRHEMSGPEEARVHDWLAHALLNLESGAPLADGLVLEP